MGHEVDWSTRRVLGEGDTDSYLHLHLSITLCCRTGMIQTDENREVKTLSTDTGKLRSNTLLHSAMT
jgi:hypothetical protein